jgi:hypothetical protein
MAIQTRIEIEAAKGLSLAQEADLVRQAARRNPSSLLMRARLAAICNLTDAFDETIALLGTAPDLGYGEAMMLVQARLAQETDADDVWAADTARLALSLASNDPERAQALADMGKAQLRRGEDSARETLRLALDIDPHNKDACKRLATYYLTRNEPAQVLALCDKLEAQGASHSRLLSARLLAHARMADLRAARALMRWEELHCEATLEPPPGWESLEAFNAALKAELLGHPGLRYERYGTASALTWRIDSPAIPAAPLVNQLLVQLREVINRHIANISEIDHSWVKARPAEATLHCWCVITDSVGYETWHVHQFGWLSGVYYVEVPAGVVHGDGTGGCLCIGLPEDLVGDEAAAQFGPEIVRPSPGLVKLFPSHTYHRTFPHSLPEQRICIAFDICPN